MIYRSRTSGRFVSVGAKNRNRRRAKAKSSVKNGRLYSYRGQIVRALQACSNGLRLVGSHGALFGFAKDTELKRIDSKAVKSYLHQS